MSIKMKKISLEKVDDIVSPTLSFSDEKYLEYRVHNDSFTILNFDEKIGIKSSLQFSYAEIGIEVPKGKFLALTISPIVDYSSGYKYYNELYAYGRTDAVKPGNLSYPVFREFKNFDDINKVGPCWSYSYVEGELAYPTIAVLFKEEGKSNNYVTYLVNSQEGVTSSIRENKLIIEGKYTPNKVFWALFIGRSEDPYESIRLAFKEMSKCDNVKLREEKLKPSILGKLGWCSWNAFLTNLSEDKVLDVIKGILNKGIKLSYVLIDDGWQKLENKVMASIDPDEAKFSGGFKRTVNELKKLGIEKVGLWHTINIYWNGYNEKVKEELGDGERTNGGYQIPHQLDRVLKVFYNFHKRVKDNGFSFVKVDNQWVIRKYPKPDEIEEAVQLSASLNGLEVMNCMSMVPECYTNYFLSNIMRTSNDYIPMWKDDTKLHLLFNAYNSLFFSNIAYPDYDMFVSYDDYALPHLIFRIFSGGPVYITDKDPSRTNVELLRKVMIEDKILTVDFPGLVTKDILFVNPLREEKLLKLASKSNGIPVVAVVNINSRRIKDKIRAEDFPYPLNGDLMYYMVIRGEHGYLKDLELELDEMEAEILVISSKGSPIGLKEYLLPPATIKDGRTLALGTLVFLDEEIKEIKVNRGYQVNLLP